MARAKRKIRKKRGSRTCGGGSHKKHRGAGNRGGTGLAGTHKHKMTWVIKYSSSHFGRHGFKLPKELKEKTRAINVGELEMLARDHGVKKGKKVTLDLSSLGYTKVLGKGRVTTSLVVIAHSFTEKAIQKIESAGGKAESLSE
jgi:large subunit ribosomal protein L15